MTAGDSKVPKAVIDAHVHFWDPKRVHIPWLVNAPHFNEERTNERYSAEIHAHTQVKAAVFVEVDADPAHGLVEAEWITKYAKQFKPASAQFGGIQAIVAYAPVQQGAQAIHPYLQLLKQLTDEKLRGVRYLIQDPSLDPERVASPAFVSGVRALADYDLSFDLNINCHAAPAQFPPLISLVRQCPEVTFILDHMAKPPCNVSSPADPAFKFWQQNMQALAAFPNVSCKVSGLVTETQTWTAAQLRPFVQVARNTFGIDRLLFGGDWPICENAVRWRTWLEVLSEVVEDWSEEDKDKLFVSNAARVYRL
ncbi:hypothetical protein BDB00DRAFT_852388 [Zychaea mexicana]|uniref:uncharacterized protein n=1 Tax=Zychaea mexicana TaxID=64656 RepID=UPI0022FE43FF|nr:uncharacterized protein BDB00DRAFT_852388 [Zychaea mexicana]KAI9484959.1 hypothetical protein BDB00DRAFT_852388 [Zychaea mexicana]